MKIETFKRNYVKAIMDGNAAVFAGAGLSRPSGFVVWKELLRPLAEEIGIIIDKETDLTAIAQYYRNASGNRGSINQTILDAYSRDVEINENVRILTRLPIYTYWTTNYDHLIEEGLRACNRNADVKMESKQLAQTKRDRDAILYKMHGDADHPADAVLTNDDYMRYEKNYPFFRSVLQGDLISKTFLFIGFSFEDPNLDSVLRQIRMLMDDNLRNHYCFMKSVSRDDASDDEEYGYLKARQDLQEQYLKEYGIQTVFLKEYSEITEILRDVERAVLANNVFISGSADIFEGDWPQAKANKLAFNLAQAFVKEEFKVTSGFGLGIGSSVINGALDEIYRSKYKHLDEHLCLRPFPQNIPDADTRKAKWTQYRREILSDNGVAVFIFGNKKATDGSKVSADGCLEEYRIAKEQGTLIIPVGSSGDAAKLIYDEVKGAIDDYPYLKDFIDDLGTVTDVERLVQIVVSIAKRQRLV